GNADALTNLATLGNDGTFVGSLTIQNGRNFTTSNAVSVCRNEGTLTVGIGSIFIVSGNYTQLPTATAVINQGRLRVQGSFTNFTGTTLTGGTYRITGPANSPSRGTLQFA